MNDSFVEILMATYNGEKFLSDQLESILNQTHQNLRILIRDDGSTDTTLQIIERYKSQHPEKIILLPNTEDKASGPIQNFSKLLSFSTAPYVLLSDQDDFWLPEKISILLAAIQEIEQQYSPALPILVHSDLLVVDERLHTINRSFWNYIGVNSNRDSFENLLVQNIVTGCAAILNRSLVDLCGPIPKKAMMHDWWLALAASSMGNITKIDLPTVMYRQHGANTLGAKQFSWTLSYFVEKFKILLKPEEKYFLTECIAQAEEFYSAYHKKLPTPMLNKLIAFKDLKSQNFIDRRLTILRGGFTKAKLIQNIGLLLRV